MAKQKVRQPVSWEAVTPATGTVAPCQRFRVKLSFLPEMVVEAASQEEAIEAYNRMMGVTHTVNRHEIGPATE